ncbi:hypothetical protein PBI_SCTP2_184 [Salicola phage SCTP-2]|nr:hypothetical protein PBI_SCTP2_184 [Salicola phage SCTP-2]
MFLNNIQYKTFKKFPNFLKQSVIDHDNNNDYHPHFYTKEDGVLDEISLIFKDIYTYYGLSYIDVTNILIVLLTPNKIKNIPEEQYIKELEVAHDFSLLFDYYHEDCCNITNIKTYYFEYNIEAFLYVLFKMFFSEYHQHSETNNKETIGNKLLHHASVNKKLITNNYGKIDRVKNNYVKINTNFFNTIIELYIKNDNIRYYLTSIMRNDINLSDVSASHYIPSYALVVYIYIFLGINEKIQYNKSDDVWYAYNYCLEKIISDMAERHMEEMCNVLIFPAKHFFNKSKYINTYHINTVLVQTEFIMNNYNTLKNKKRLKNIIFIDYFTNLIVNVLGIILYNDKQNKTITELEHFIKECPEELFSKLFYNYDELNKLVKSFNSSKIFKTRWNKLKLQYNLYSE